MHMEAEALAPVAANLQHLRLCDVWAPDGTFEEGTSLLAQLAAMQQLTYLHLQDTLDTEGVPFVNFSGLTASSRLQDLHVEDNSLYNGVWQHVFATGRVLPVLRQLTVRAWFFDLWSYEYLPSLNTRDVERMVRCCPGLQRLDIVAAPGVQLQALLQLTQLQHLEVSGAYQDDANVTQLSSLVSLTHLRAEL